MSIADLQELPELPSNDTFIEIECFQKTKSGQAACGDDFKVEHIDSEERYIAVLSDGLGSGIKASLLANMTTTMALEFVKSNMDILKSAETIMDTLPVCEYRKISYATFTVLDILPGGRVRMVEMDNPPYIHLRNNCDLHWDKQVIFSEKWPDRKLSVSEFRAVQGDRIIFCSDGITQAGLGHAVNKFGWRREGCLEFIQQLLARNPAMSARDLSRAIVAQACTKNPGFQCFDDMSCAVVYFRKPRRLRLLTGPPFRAENDHDFAEMVVGFDGKTIISGGTTANIVSRELKRKITIDLKSMSSGLPPVSKMAGVDLVTEGILTLTVVARILEGESVERSAAVDSMINMLIESDVIEFIVGTKVNEAHQDPSLPVDLEIRRNIVKRIKTVLEDKYRKKVIIRYF